jgi:phage tail-like protein
MSESPFQGFQYRVEVDGILVAGFKTVTGLDSAGNAGSGNATLTSGITDSKRFFEWIEDCLGGEITRMWVTVIELNTAGEKVATWQLNEAWPTACRVHQFRSSTSEMGLVSLELAYVSMTQVK